MACKRLPVFLLLFFVTAFSAWAQLSVRVLVPTHTPSDSKIFVAGSFNGWQPGHVAFALNRNPDGSYSFLLPMQQQAVEFKFTRGNWETVEVNPDGTDRENRQVNPGQKGEISLTIQQWADLVPDKKTKSHTASGNVRVLREDFQMTPLDRIRRVWIYLPPGYDENRRHYPVLYLQDGQNLFDAFYGFNGEWAVDETLDSLYENKKNGLIVVGVDHGGEKRLAEYSPWRHPKYGGGEGKAYADFLVKTLKPYVDRHFRTRPQARHTGIAGSSMGGLMAFYTATRHPGVFGRVGVLSPSVWFSDSIFAWAQTHPFHSKARVLFLAGGEESAGMVPDLKKLYGVVSRQSGRRKFKLVVQPDGRHSEWFWRREFAGLVQFLF